MFGDKDPMLPLVLILQELRRHWRNFPVGHMLLFLEVARNDLNDLEMGVIELGEGIGLSQASTSRHLVDLSPRTIPSGGDAPVDLVTTRPDAVDYRKRVPCLTAKGRVVYQHIKSILATTNTNPKRKTITP